MALCSIGVSYPPPPIAPQGPMRLTAAEFCRGPIEPSEWTPLTGAGRMDSSQYTCFGPPPARTSSSSHCRFPLGCLAMQLATRRLHVVPDHGFCIRPSYPRRYWRTGCCVARQMSASLKADRCAPLGQMRRQGPDPAHPADGCPPLSPKTIVPTALVSRVGRIVTRVSQSAIQLSASLSVASPIG
jgi:hypothetical protein